MAGTYNVSAKESQRGYEMVVVDRKQTRLVFSKWENKDADDETGS
jgi:hypothetical protein